MFVYEPTFNTLDLQEGKGTNYIIVWKSKVLFKSKLLPLCGVLLPNIKPFRYKIGIQCNNTPSALDQHNYGTKIVNVHIAYDLDNWPKNSLKNFTSKNCLFGATNLVKVSNKSKHFYTGHGIAFDGAGSWSFGNYYARNVVIFCVNNSLSSHTENGKNIFFSVR